MLTKAEAAGIVTDLDGILGENSADGTIRREVERLSERVSSVASDTETWLSHELTSESVLPEEVSLLMPGWTAAELLSVFKPLYPATQGMSSPNTLTTYVSTKIRRFPNPEFESRFSAKHHTAAEYLYDRTDALFFAAMRWGGRECSLQAMIARQELGWLRDVRFVFPDLTTSQ